MKSEQLDHTKDMLKRIDWRTKVVGVDEANFMGPDLIEIAGTLADSGRQVIIAGLDTDYIGRPFSAIPELLALAESITKILAVLCSLWKPSQAHATSTRVRRSSRCRGRRESAPSGFPRKPEMPARITYKGAN
jgi:thymidine kinase